MKKITVKINKKTGKVIAETEGYLGKECVDAISFIDELSSNKTVEHKPEYNIEQDVLINTGS